MQASNEKPRLPSWVRIALLLFGVLLILLIYSTGSTWVGQVVFFLAALAATWLLDPNWRPLARVLVILVSLTLLLTTASIQLLDVLVQARIVQQTPALNSLLNSPEAKGLLSLMAAVAISTVTVAITLAVAVWTSAEWILALREVEGVTLAQALRLLLTMMFRTAYAYYVVENGEITETKPRGILPALGGPGKVVIRPYNAVIFERSGEITRIEGPGLVITDRGEMSKAIFDLRKQWTAWTTDDLLTRDHVPLRFNCGVGFRIESARETSQRIKLPIPDHLGGRFPDLISGDYKVYQHTLYRAAYETTAAGWQTSTQALTETMLLNIVREYLLEDFYRLEEGRLVQEESIMAKIVQETMEQTNRITHSWGVTVTAFKITNFEAPRDIKEKLFEMWAARYAERSKLIEAEAERDAMVVRGKGQAAALAHVEHVKASAVQMLINQLLRGIREAEHVNLDPKVIERFAGVIEQLSSNLVHDDLTAPRYVEALERIAASETTKTIAMGNTMLDPGLPVLPRRQGSDKD